MPYDLVLTGGHVIDPAQGLDGPADVAFRDGRVAAIGPGLDTGGAGEVRSAAGCYVTPGLIDAHSHLGVYSAPGFEAHSDGNGATAPVTSGVWAEHGLWPHDPGIETAVAGGVTSMLVLPGSANLIGGRGITVHLVPARGSRAMRAIISCSG